MGEITTKKTLNWFRGQAEKKTDRQDVPGLERVSAVPRGKGKQVVFESSRHWRLENLNCTDVNGRSPERIVLRADKPEIQ